MSESDNKHRKPAGGKRKSFPVFGIVLIVCFVTIPAIFFFMAMQDAPGRPTAAVETPPGDEVAETVQPTITIAEPTEEPKPTLPPPVKAKGIYFIANYANDTNLAACLDLIESSVMNAIVIDVKNDYGTMSFATDNEVLAPASAAYEHEARTTGARMTKATLDDIKSRGIYMIARVVCFKDDFGAGENPSFAIQSRLGGTWRDKDNKRWLDPYNRDSWEYIAEACREAARLGFDEVQLDYVRFPVDRNIGDIAYSAERDYYSKSQIINDFVAFIRDEMLEIGLRTSVDIFGISGISTGDADDLGQDVSMLLGSAHSLCPMIYPSHFAHDQENGVGQNLNGVLFERPDTQPYEVIYNALQHYIRRVEQFVELNPDEEPAIIRPYLQYFTWDSLPEGYWIEYGSEEISAQIQAVTDAGLDEWLFWTFNNGFDIEVD